VYPFKDNIDLPIMELYSSVTTISGPQSHKWYARLDDLFPRLYAFLHNKHLLNKYRDAPVTLMLDFIKKWIMKLVNSKAEYIPQEEGLGDIYKKEVLK